MQIWNRDVSAAKNILRVLLAKVRGERRPTELEPPGDAPREPAAAALTEAAHEADELAAAQDAA